MHLSRESVAGVAFLTSVREGRGLKPSARAAGVGKETGYRWLRESFIALRDRGFSVQRAQAELGYRSPLVHEWERQRRERRSADRHHLRVDERVERVFWRCFESGESLDASARAAGVARSTGYRWWQTRFVALRADGVPLRVAARRLRMPGGRAREWEAARRTSRRRARVERDVVERRAVRAAVRESERAAELAGHARPLRADARDRDTRYWELMRSGMTNTGACKILGVTRKTGQRIRARRRHQSVAVTRPATPSGRYLSLTERLRIADLMRLDYSMRGIAAELGRAPSTIKRELDRHRDAAGRYLPRTADHAAHVQRRRPKRHKLLADPGLCRLVQRKLNRCWSPDEISGWLRRTYPDDLSMRICPETIYRALLVPGGKGLHKRYCRRLRTGRRIRRSRWLTRPGHGASVQGKTMIDKRPAEVETKQQVGHWEGDLILGAGCRSAMVTLRERKTQHGIVINLPVDHTAPTVNAAVAAAFAPLPAHMKRTLTWDQGVEMAAHRDLAAATGVAIYFAERCSPWQRGANENYNGLLRQYFPKGTDLSVHTDRHVTVVMNEINDRPRKTLGYDTPAARFRAESRTLPTTTRTVTATPIA